MPTFEIRQSRRVERHQLKRLVRRQTVLEQDKRKYKGKAFTRQVHK